MAGGDIKAVEAVRALQQKMTVGEHVVNAFEAALSAFPVGGAIASLMKDYIPNRRAARVIEFAQAVAKELEAIANRIDTDYVKSDDFAYLFEQCFKGVADNYQSEKLKAYRAIFINSLTQPGVSEERKQMYLRALDQMLPIHIRLLSALDNPRRYAQIHFIQPKIYSVRMPVDILFEDLGFGGDEFEVAAADLDRLALTQNLVGWLKVIIGGGSIEDLKGSLTGFGKGLAQFISSEATDPTEVRG